MTPFATSPAHAVARAARDDVTSLLPITREIPLKIDRDSIAVLLARALKALFITLDTSIDAPAHHDALVECRDSLAEARALFTRGHEAHATTLAPLVRALAVLDRARVSVEGAAREVADLQFARRHELRGGASSPSALPVRPMRASIGVPELHAPARAPMVQRISLDPVVDLIEERPVKAPPPKPKTLEELRNAVNSASNGNAASAAAPTDAAERAGDANALRAAMPLADERELVRRVARDCLEDIAILSMLRNPIPTETWLDQAPFEDRLLQNLDAFVSLGEAALPQIALFHAEAAAPDATRGFAVAFTLGCLEGTDAAEIAIAVLKESALEEYSGWATGFSLASSPAIDAALVELCDSPNATLAAFAIGVLARRGALPILAAEKLLARTDPESTLAVVRALGFAGVQKRAIELLSAVIVSDTDDALFAAVNESRLRRGDGNARAALREALAHSSRSSPARVAAAARLLAVSGRAADVDVLLAASDRAPSIATASALGRFGHVNAVPVLLALLLSKDEGVAPAASAALTQITGMTFPDHAAWSDFWKKSASRFPTDTKLRAGIAFTPKAIVDELRSKATSVAAREYAALEWITTTGAITRFFPRDWVARQQMHLDDMASRIPNVAPGAWSFFGASTSAR